MLTEMFRVGFAVNLFVNHRYFVSADCYSAWEQTSCKAQVPSNFAARESLGFHHKVDVEGNVFHFQMVMWSL